jgi:anti-sigma regulatory factor (Ser/Thr protein kinase)
MASFEKTFGLHVPSSTENLSMIRDFVRSIGTQSGMGDLEVARLEMAMEHAYSSDSTKEVSIQATVDETALRVVVVDTGKGFDPAAVEQKKLEDLISAKRTGGLGMRLIKSFMDEVHYAMVPGVKNELTMVKLLAKNG